MSRSLLWGIECYPFVAIANGQTCGSLKAVPHSGALIGTQKHRPAHRSSGTTAERHTQKRKPNGSAARRRPVAAVLGGFLCLRSQPTAAHGRDRVGGNAQTEETP